MLSLPQHGGPSAGLSAISVSPEGSKSDAPFATGVSLANGCRITHGHGANVKTPFVDVPLVMHELYAGDDGLGSASFRGQFGFIPLTDQLRLPRHVHLGDEGETSGPALLAERILVLNGVGLTELNGEIFLVAPGSLVDIAPGVPHTWTACPPGVRLPDGTLSDGQFLMIYEYSRRTGFFPTARTASLASAAEYERYTHDLEDIRFPELTAHQVAERASFVWDKTLRADLELAMP